jgi:hypothetical protein
VQQTISWPTIVKSSLGGVLAAWLCYVIGVAFEVFVFGGASNDIAVALFPAATMIALAVALLLFWPLTIGMARIGVTFGATQGWARKRLGWAAIGAIIGSITLALFLGVLSSWSAELPTAAAVGAGLGAATAFVTHWRLGMGRLA